MLRKITSHIEMIDDLESRLTTLARDAGQKPEVLNEVVDSLRGLISSASPKKVNPLIDRELSELSLFRDASTKDLDKDGKAILLNIFNEGINRVIQKILKNAAVFDEEKLEEALDEQSKLVKDLVYTQDPLKKQKLLLPSLFLEMPV